MRQRSILVASAIEATSRPDVVDVLRCRLSVLESLNRLGFLCRPLDVTRSKAKERASLGRGLREENPLCLFNLFEGFSDDPGQESAFAALLEEWAIPFTGNGSRTLALCLDKERTRLHLAEEGLPVPRGRAIRADDLPHLASLLPFEAPFFLKPRCEDGSVGIDETSLVTARGDLAAALAAKLGRFPQGIVIEEFLPGREFAVALLGNDPYDALPPSVIDYGRHKDLPPYLAYEAKWDETAPAYAITPEPCGDDDAEAARHLAERAGRALGCRGLFRVDLREGGDGTLRIIDVNPNPDLNVDSGFARQAGRRGLTYDDVIARLVLLALEGEEVSRLEEPCPLRLPGPR